MINLVPCYYNGTLTECVKVLGLFKKSRIISTYITDINFPMAGRVKNSVIKGGGLE